MPVNHVPLSAVGRGLPTAVPAGQPQCTIYDAHNTTRLPGDVVRTEGKWPTRDLADKLRFIHKHLDEPTAWNLHELLVRTLPQFHPLLPEPV